MPSFLRILLINYEYPPVGGGGGNNTRHIARALAHLGHAPFVLTAACGDLPRHEVTDGVTIVRIPAFRRRPDRATVPEMVAFILAAMRVVPRYAREWKIDAAIAYFGLPGGPVGWMLKRATGAPYVIYMQGGDVPGFIYPGLGFYHALTGGLLRYLWRDAYTVAGLCRDLCARAQRHAPDQDFRIMHPGADVRGIAAKADYAPRDAVELLFVGRFVRQKGLDLLFEALATIDPSLKWHLTLVGDGPERANLLAQAERLGLVHRIALRGWVKKDELAAIYRSGDVFVLPSRDEGFANVLLEAMAAGLPIMGTYVSGTDDAVIDGETGYIVQPGEVPALADRLTKLFVDAALRERMGRAARARAEAQFDWHKLAEDWVALLNEAIAAKAAH